MTVLLTVKNIFATKLIGIVPWSCVAVNNSTGQELYADVETPKGHKYKLAVKSSYSAPPLGAVTLSDGTDPKNPAELVHGQNQDATWHRVTEYIKAKEAGSSAVEAAKVAAVIPEHLQAAPVSVEPDEVDIPTPAAVYFIAGKGEFYRNGPALVTRRNADGSLNLTVFSDGSESFYQQNVEPRSEELRHHCYVEYPAGHGTVVINREPIAAAEVGEIVNALLREALPGIIDAVATRVFEDEQKRRAALIDAAAPAKSAEQIADEAFLAGEQWSPEQAAAMKQSSGDAEHTLEELERLTDPNPTAAPQA